MRTAHFAFTFFAMALRLSHVSTIPLKIDISTALQRLYGDLLVYKGPAFPADTLLCGVPRLQNVKVHSDDGVPFQFVAYSFEREGLHLFVVAA